MIAAQLSQIGGPVRMQSVQCQTAQNHDTEQNKTDQNLPSTALSYSLLLILTGVPILCRQVCPSSFTEWLQREQRNE